MAQAEIMQKLRAITEQLNSDFKGIRKDAPMFIWFQLDPCDANNRFDQIMFFADGDFQSIRPYDYLGPSGKLIPATTGSPVFSNVTRIQYCHARVYSASQAGYVPPENQQFENAFDRVLNINHRTLARRQHLLTADPDIYLWPDPCQFQTTFTPAYNNIYEPDSLSLSQGQALTYEPLNNNAIITTCFTSLDSRPSLNFGTGDGLYMLMTEGVSNFTIQLAANDANGVVLVPPTAPVGVFGVFFNIPDGAGPAGWFDWSVLWPRAIKFTFTLYDSRGVFKEGQTFTHIVYLGD
jgi:hypothetical protein